VAKCVVPVRSSEGILRDIIFNEVLS